MHFLNNKLICLTGGGRGIAKGLAHSALEKGANVGIIDINEATFADMPEAVFCFQGDVSKTAEIERFYTKATEHFGQKIDYVVASAVASAMAESESREDFFDRMVAINFKGMYFSMSLAFEHMNDNGSIVSMLAASSLDDVKTTAGTWSEYTAIKQAMKYLTKSLAANAERGIRVNGVSPGWIKSERVTAIAERMGFSEQDMGETTTAKRMGTAQDMANAVFFLFSPESSYINGVDLPVEGGFAVKGSNLPT